MAVIGPYNAKLMPNLSLISRKSSWQATLIFAFVNRATGVHELDYRQ